MFTFFQPKFCPKIAKWSLNLQFSISRRIKQVEHLCTPLFDSQLSELKWKTFFFFIFQTTLGLMVFLTLNTRLFQPGAFKSELRNIYL